MMTSSEILGFPIRYSGDYFYLLGKKYRLSPGSVRSLGLFLDLVASAAKAQDTCLLYTSPSPRDRQKSRMPSSA